MSELTKPLTNSDFHEKVLESLIYLEYVFSHLQSVHTNKKNNYITIGRSNAIKVTSYSTVF